MINQPGLMAIVYLWTGYSHEACAKKAPYWTNGSKNSRLPTVYETGLIMILIIGNSSRGSIKQN
jgi:hypothetical protein